MLKSETQNSTQIVIDPTELKNIPKEDLIQSLEFFRNFFDSKLQIVLTTKTRTSRNQSKTKTQRLKDLEKTIQNMDFRSEEEVKKILEL